MGQDQVLNDAIATARDQFELLTDLAIMVQTFKLTLRELPADLRLPKPPLAVLPNLVVKYVDADGNEQTLDAARYRVIPGGYSNARLLLDTSQALPLTSGGFPWTVQFDAGQAAAGSVWSGIRGAILLLAAYLYEHRVTAEPGQLMDLPHAFDSIAQQYKVYWP